MKIAVNVLEDEKRLQVQGKLYYTVDRLEDKKRLQVQGKFYCTVNVS